MAPLQPATNSLPAAVAEPRASRGERAGALLERARSSRYADAVLLGAIVAAVTAACAHYALRTATFQNDETLYLQQARLLAEYFPGPLFDSAIFQRGLQRLDQTLIAIPFVFWRGPIAFQLARVIQCLLFASAAIPTYLLARGSGLGRMGSQLAALLAVVVPWAVVSTSFLTESAAYPTYAWSLYAVWAAIVRPSRIREALAVLAIVLAALSRSAMVALAPLLPLAVLWQELRWDMAGRGLWSRIGALPGRLWRGHPLVTVATGAGIALYLAARTGLLPSFLTTLTGQYGIPHIGPLSPLFKRYEYFLSRSVAGTGLIATAIGLPWLVGTLVRPRDGARHALAVVCLLGVACMLLSLIPAGPDERYTAYAAVPIALLFVAGLRTRPGLGVLAGAIVVDLLIESVTWPPLANLYDYFTYPAAIFYQRVLLGHASTISLPLVHIPPERLVQLAVLVVALVWLLAGRSARLARPAAVVLGVVVLALGAMQAYYAMDKFVATAGAGPNATARSWVDRQVPGDADVAVVPISLGLSLDFTPIWETAEMWNRSVDATAFFESNTAGAPLDIGRAPLPVDGTVLYLKTNVASGSIGITESGAVRPATLRYVLVPEVSMTTVGFATESSQLDPYLLVRLERLRQPPRLEWLLGGTSEEGFMVPGMQAEARVFHTALARGVHCASFSLAMPPDVKGTWPYAISAAGGRTLARGRLSEAHPTLVRVPLIVKREAGWPVARLAIAVQGSIPYPGGKTVSARLDEFALGSCKSYS